MTNNQRIFSPHAFRANVDAEPELFPMTAPEGKAFYLVTPTPHALPAKKRYLYDLLTTGGRRKVTVTYSRDRAKKFTNLRLAESFATFLNDPKLIQHEYEFWIVLEPPEYVGDESIKQRMVSGK